MKFMILQAYRYYLATWAWVSGGKSTGIRFLRLAAGKTRNVLQWLY